MTAGEENADKLRAEAEEHLKHYRKQLPKPGTFSNQEYRLRNHTNVTCKSLVATSLNSDTT